MKPSSLHIKLHGLRVHVSCCGEPTSPVVILLHGIRDHSRGWDWVAQALSARYRIYAPDLRGHGDTGWSVDAAYHLTDFVVDLEDLTRALGLDRFAVVGHSFGGAIGLRYSAAFPEKVTAYSGIECIEMPILRDQRVAPKPHATRLRNWIDTVRTNRGRAARDYLSPADAEQRMIEENPELPAETVAHLVQHGLRLTSEGHWRWKYDNAARQRPPDDTDGRDLDGMLEAISCPVMLAYGTASWVEMPPKERLDRIRQLSVVEFPNASHWLHHTSRQPYIDALHDFLTTVF